MGFTDRYRQVSRGTYCFYRQVSIGVSRYMFLQIGIDRCLTIHSVSTDRYRQVSQDTYCFYRQVSIGVSRNILFLLIDIDRILTVLLVWTIGIDSLSTILFVRTMGIDGRSTISCCFLDRFTRYYHLPWTAVYHERPGYRSPISLKRKIYVMSSEPELKKRKGRTHISMRYPSVDGVQQQSIIYR